MHWTRHLAAVLSLTTLICGCAQQEPAAQPARPANGEPVAAQPHLRTMKLWIGAAEMEAELAMRPNEIRTGMMFRTNMPPDTGMLFVFPYPHQASFWMKNTSLPLSAAYISPEGEILELHDLEPHNTNSVTAGSDRIQFVLEAPHGWFRQNNISTGAWIRTESGPLLDAFQRRRP